MGQPSGPRRPHRCHHHQVTEGFGPVALNTESKLDLTYSPQNVGTLPSATSGFAGRWNRDQHRAGRTQQNHRKRFAHCAQQKKLFKMMAYEIISAMVLPPRKEPKAALAHFNCYLKGSGAFSLPLPSFSPSLFFVF